MKKKQKNLGVKIIAGLALVAIIIGIIGTGALVLTSIFAPSSTNPPQDISPEALEDVINIADQSEIIGDNSTIDSPSSDNIEFSTTTLEGEEDSTSAQ